MRDRAEPSGVHRKVSILLKRAHRFDTRAGVVAETREAEAMATVNGEHVLNREDVKADGTLLFDLDFNFVLRKSQRLGEVEGSQMGQ